MEIEVELSNIGMTIQEAAHQINVVKAALKEANLYGQQVFVYKRIGAYRYEYGRNRSLLAGEGWELECSILPTILDRD